ncbi:MAG: hypothetical protein AAF573_05710 [Bacteroidota bacterium]
MNQRSFFIQLAIVSAVTLVLLLLLHQVEHFSPYQSFSYGSLIGFILLSVGMYLLSARAAVSSDKNLFLQQVLGTTFFKMLLCIVVIVGYSKLAAPPTKMYAVPFLGIYLIFTIFETYFMMKLSKVKPATHGKE